MKTNNRHLTALILSIMIYGMAIGAILGFEVENENTSTTPIIEKSQSVKIAIITPLQFEDNFKTKHLPQEKIEEITPKNIIEKVPPKIEPIIEKTIAQKNIEKPVEKPIEKKIEPTLAQNTQVTKIEPKQELKHFPKIEQPIQKENLATQKVEQKGSVVTKPVIEQVQKVVVNESNNEELKNKKRAYFQLVKSMIEKNKYYPQNALRRGIECDMKVKFMISPMGEFLSLEMIDGNKIFHNSVKEAIEKSFPLLPPKNVLSGNEVLSLVISYTIN